MGYLFCHKPLDVLMCESEEEGEHTLKRVLGPWALTLLGIGAIVGAGTAA